MQVIHTIAEFRRWRWHLPARVAVPFAPTMGALHPGHISLIMQARNMDHDHDHVKVISSIFVNPTQFGPTEDFAKYPRPLEADLEVLEAAGCDAVFVPSAGEMYPDALSSGNGAAAPTINPGPMGEILEGAIRPTHFAGVCTVVAKLLNITAATHLLLGQKDFQQQAILRHMARSLNLNVQVITCPTMRESDGLAMSSRNRYLKPEDRAKAPAIHETLQWAKAAIENGERNPGILEPKMHRMLDSHGLVPQYATVRRPDTLAEFSDVVSLPCVLLVAAKLGTTRLIDNLLITAAAERGETHGEGQGATGAEEPNLPNTEISIETSAS